MQEQHTQGDLLCPVDGCRRGVPGKGFKRCYRLVNHLMASSQTRARGHDLGPDEAQCCADAVVDAVKVQRAAAAYALFVDAGMVVPSNLGGAPAGAAIPPATISDSTTMLSAAQWPPLPAPADMPDPFVTDAVEASSASHAATLDIDAGMHFDNFVCAARSGSLSDNEDLAAYVDAASPTDHLDTEDFVIDPSLLSPTGQGLEEDSNATSFIMDMDDEVESNTMVFDP